MKIIIKLQVAGYQLQWLQPTDYRIQSSFWALAQFPFFDDELRGIYLAKANGKNLITEIRNQSAEADYN